MAKERKVPEAAENAEANSLAEAENAENEATACVDEETNEPKYTAAEFVKAADVVFKGKYNADIVQAAFLMAGVKEATKKQAEKLVEEFAHKEVNRK